MTIDYTVLKHHANSPIHDAIKELDERLKNIEGSWRLDSSQVLTDAEIDKLIENAYCKEVKIVGIGHLEAYHIWRLIYKTALKHAMQAVLDSGGDNKVTHANAIGVLIGEVCE